MMLIVVDARTLGSRPSGVGMYLNDFLKELIKYHEFRFILLSDVATSEYIDYFMCRGIEVRTQGAEVYKSAEVYSYFNFVQKELYDIKPDLFWEVNTVIPIKLRGSHKTMITIHDMFPITHVKYFGLIYSLYFRYGLHKTLKNTDMILYNSNQTKITTEKIFLRAAKIPSCIGYIIANPLVKQVKVQDDGYLLYVGNMEKRKGVDLLLKSYKEYKKRGGVKKLILAGKMQENEIDLLLKDVMDKTEGIEYLDYVSHEKKHELFANCSCFVFPSKAEGFGMPVIEVMKMGKPIITSNLEIFDELMGSCIHRFDINVNEKQQISNLAEELLKMNDDIVRTVDIEAYKQIIARFAPEKLGAVVREFIDNGVE